MKPGNRIISTPDGNEDQSMAEPSTSQRPPSVTVNDLNRSSSVNRIKKELDEIRRNPPPNCRAEIYKGDLYRWTGFINGPHGTVYEGGSFKLDIRFPSAYPFRPPRVRFTTRIYHCNVDSRGAICLDVLNERWSPVMTIAKVLLSIWVLVGECNPNDPLVICIADQYLCNRKEHDKIARSWTLRYAKHHSTTPKMATEQTSDETLIPE